METFATASDTTATSAPLPSTSQAQSTSPALLAHSPKVPLDQFGAMQIKESSDRSDEPAEAKQPTTGRETKWDEEDEVWRCWDCFWEVEHGECVYCGTTYERSEETVAREEELFADSEQLEPILPKSRPPSPWLPEAFLAAAKEPLSKEDQLKFLLARGATTEMIERYDLEYSPLYGIIATADDELEEFFFPDGFELAQYERSPQEIAKLREEDENFFPREPFPMQKPDDKRPWRIHLGDWIDLSPLDTCGSDFVFNAAESLLWQSDHGRAATVVEQFGPYGQDGQQFVTRKLDKEDEEIMTLSEFGAKWPSTDHLYDAHELDILCIPVKCDGNYEPLLLAEAKKSEEETEELNATTEELWAGSEIEQEEDDESEAHASGGDISMQVEEEHGGEAEQLATERMEDEPEEPGEIFEFA
ncbi:Proteophosphoglycan ppg4 [Rhodotorula toruloides ATCC 204091]|uniref:BY PROTMAP: gi/342320876/gb/EGU12814.1/ Proteophosphoglycan ppg4 [Rhodotorula glutinis ATCC 204091] n=1 Tax=Rhodotorula toruloides TaxID=5286 RepID=A0A0K3CDS3_RHOTO|nr:Proteophosphoglycan ppg4 [Rhodotorula toruloides ATCC 204091]